MESLARLWGPADRQLELKKLPRSDLSQRGTSLTTSAWHQIAAWCYELWAGLALLAARVFLACAFRDLDAPSLPCHHLSRPIDSGNCTLVFSCRISWLARATPLINNSHCDTLFAVFNPQLLDGISTTYGACYSPLTDRVRTHFWRSRLLDTPPNRSLRLVLPVPLLRFRQHLLLDHDADDNNNNNSLHSISPDDNRHDRPSWRPPFSF